MSAKNLLTLTEVPDHFERDTHALVRNAGVKAVHVLPGETELEDVTLVIYQGVPAISFYNAYGRLIDIDHYLPDTYVKHNQASGDQLLRTLGITVDQDVTSATKYASQLARVMKAGSGQLSKGLALTYGLRDNPEAEAQFLLPFRDGKDKIQQALLRSFRTMAELVKAYVQVQLVTDADYVHLTSAGNLIITPLNRASGMAVMIETNDERGRPLPVSAWRITRTNSPIQLEKALVFRTDDIRAYFDTELATQPQRTDRYELRTYPQRLTFDSLLDQTDNLLTVALHQNCWQRLASDPEIIIALSGPRKITVVNTHRSIVPQKWADVITLPTDTDWMRVDENLSVLFALDPQGQLLAYDISGDQASPVGTVTGPFARGFAIDQSGGLTLVERYSGKLVRMATNVNEVRLPGREANFAEVFQDLSDLFRGESLFTKAVYAQKVTDQPEPPSSLPPSALEVARFDYEANVDHLLTEAGNDYEQLLAVREKLAIARRNITDEFTQLAEAKGIRLVGKRLQQTVRNITRASERRVTGLIESIRAERIIEMARGYQSTLASLTDPGAYRDALNDIRNAGEELKRMSPDNVEDILPEFRAIAAQLNELFSKQIAEDGNALQAFILGEIDEIEAAITATYEARQLESLLNTHPAALELMTLLKQPFVLQSVSHERSLSPAGIQQRLHTAVEQRLAELRAEEDKKDAERNTAKIQLAGMAREAIDFFISHHSGGFSDITLSNTPAYQSILSDIGKVERDYDDVRLAGELRQRLERVILDRNRADLERAVAYEGKYAFVQNDPELYVDLDSTVRRFPKWQLELIEKVGDRQRYLATFIRDTDREVYRPSTTENLLSGRAFEVEGDSVSDYLKAYYRYEAADYGFEWLDALWSVANEDATPADYPQFNVDKLKADNPQDEVTRRALGAAREKKLRDRLERTRERNVPPISPDFIDETPYFQSKLREFFIKAKLQLGTGGGVLLLSGPPSTGKSAFLKFAAALMNREYFEHASDKWQTKNSLVTAVRFGENGPFTTPAGFTRAITTAHSLINIEEIKEWPEALRKSLNPFFAGSKEFIAPDGTAYQIGENILLCAAANLGAMYRQDDEPFTADFWSRIEVVEYHYAPHHIDEEYFHRLHEPLGHYFLTIQDLVRDTFDLSSAGDDPNGRAKLLARSLLDFLLLPKADDRVKRDRLSQEINAFFEASVSGKLVYGPEEAAKVALRRVKDLQSFTAAQFFDLYDHFINGKPLRDPEIDILQTTDTARYEHLNIVFLTLWHLEGCLRHVRNVFQRSAGQSEIEGTNREFIAAVYLLGLMGRLT